MSWNPLKWKWKSIGHAVGIGAEVAGEVIQVVQPASVIGKALDKGGEVLANATKDEKPADEPKPEEPAAK